MRGNVLVRFYDGVDAASPIRDSGYDADEGNPVTSTVSVSPSAGDLVIALGLSYTPDSDISWSGAGVSEIFERTANSVNTSWAESSSSGTVTVSATGSYPGLAVIVLKPSAGGTAQTITGSLDALVKNTGVVVQPSIDALLKESFVATSSADALLSILGSQNISADALIRAALSGDVSIDAALRAVLLSSSQLDALFSAAFSSASNVDALLQSGITRTALIDAILSGPSTSSL